MILTFQCRDRLTKPFCIDGLKKLKIIRLERWLSG